MSIQRIRDMVHLAVPTLFRQIHGGRVRCDSEATLQLHLGRIIATVADLSVVYPRETFSIELEKPLSRPGEERGRLDIWFRLVADDGIEWRCALELKFLKRANHREPNNRYDVFKDIARLERCGDVANLGFMLVATDHPHYITQPSYSADTGDFDFRDGKLYRAGTVLTYSTGGYGEPISLGHDYHFMWAEETMPLRYLLLEVVPL
jgi:hypothetical protein